MKLEQINLGPVIPSLHCIDYFIKINDGVEKGNWRK